MTHQSVADELLALEQRLLRPEVRGSREALASMLADNFAEFGSSGQVWDKEGVIRALQGNPSMPATLSEFKATGLAPDTVLATYRITRRALPQEPQSQSLRSSIWQRIDGRWQLVFHQATPLPRRTCDSPDLELVEVAREMMRARYKPEWHSVACAIRTASGHVFTSVHLEANVGRIAVCAEAVALGMGAADGDTSVELIVAVDQEGNVVAPCGMCRELISDYSPTARVIVPSATGPIIVNVGELLPNKYVRREI